MTPEQIATWAASGKSETLEFKRTTGERREAARTLCAMMNHRGGRVLFGVEPGGRAIGQQVSDHTIEDVAQELREIDPPAYPSIGGGSVAVAVYDDRLEVTSSGTLHFGFTAEALFAPHESLPWNPLIARVFFRRGVIESWGRGTIKMAELTRLAGLPLPEIEDAGGCVTVRFRPSRYLPPQRVAHDLTERQRGILALLEASRGGLALREIRAGVGGAPAEWEVKDDLALLKQLELVESRGHGRGAYWILVNQ